MHSLTKFEGRCVGAPILSAYQSTIHASEGLCESLYHELQPFGIKVVVIEPSFIQTNIMNSSIFAKGISNPEFQYYQATQSIEKYFRSIVNNDSNATSASQVANAPIGAVTAYVLDHCYLVGNDAKTILEVKNK
ncbi:MAG: hypothetical protein DA329_08265 [Candidatus Nitrosocosmicus sp.]|nr:hypothetical protein [Candidatus Nitrosocosmicus sp.]